MTTPQYDNPNLWTETDERASLKSSKATRRAREHQKANSNREREYQRWKKRRERGSWQ